MSRRWLWAVLVVVLAGTAVGAHPPHAQPVRIADPAPARLRPDVPRPLIAQRVRVARQLLRERHLHHRALSIRTDQVRDMRRVLAHESSIDEAIALAATVYGVDEGAMRTVAWCESNMTATDEHPTSHASGLFQFLPSTWQSYKFSRFSVWSPYANALAAAYVVSQDGGWGQWVCKP